MYVLVQSLVFLALHSQYPYRISLAQPDFEAKRNIFVYYLLDIDMPIKCRNWPIKIYEYRQVLKIYFFETIQGADDKLGQTLRTHLKQ